jgi:hypothetical protein
MPTNRPFPAKKISLTPTERIRKARTLPILVRAQILRPPYRIPPPRTSVPPEIAPHQGDQTNPATEQQNPRKKKPRRREERGRRGDVAGPEEPPSAAGASPPCQDTWRAAARALLLPLRPPVSGAWGRAGEGLFWVYSASVERKDAEYTVRERNSFG